MTRKSCPWGHPGCVCPWCEGSEEEYPDTDELCRPHLADYEGMSLAELDRMESEQAAEYRDWAYG